MSEKMCPDCNVAMKLESKGYAMGSPLAHNRVHADIYSCPKCKQVRLFATESDLVTCPVCGTKHHANERCLICALNQVPGANAAS